MEEIWKSNNKKCKGIDKINNVLCILRDSGRWDRGRFKDDDNPIRGKWMALVKPIGIGNDGCVPISIPDVIHTINLLLEAEKRNDAFIFKDGSSRTPQFLKTVNILLEEIENIKKEKEISLNAYL